ncbi:Hydroxysteroid dehydrogenase-like protein 2 [Aix galericulata]|nr:Hydroxysteroid dehydrogenase-like protein 2 [Aix galericulata]
MSMSSGDFVKMFTGKLKPTMAFMSGKLKIKGNMALAIKLEKMLTQPTDNLVAVSGGGGASLQGPRERQRDEESLRRDRRDMQCFIGQESQLCTESCHSLCLQQGSKDALSPSTQAPSGR